MKVKRLIRKVEKFDSSHCANKKIKIKKNLIIFIGKGKYPSKNNVNVSSFGLYLDFNFSEVAFLCNSYTLDLFSIVGILTGKIDDAGLLIDELIRKNIMDNFAKYLLYKKRVILVNAVSQYQQIDNLLSIYKKHQVFICYGSKFKLNSLNNLNKEQTNNKYNYIFCTNHPCSTAYMSGSKVCCQTYLSHTYKDIESNLTIKDFKVF